MGEIVEEIRAATQPHLIVCERTCGGEYENFITPEKTVPEQAMDVPWETCTTVGDKFSFHYTDDFKTGRELVHLLLDVVSKGGNLALNIDSEIARLLPAPAVRSLREMGAWLKLLVMEFMKLICVPRILRKSCSTRKNRIPCLLFMLTRMCLFCPKS